MIASVTGIGWVTATNMGCARDGDEFAFGEGPLPNIEHERLFEEPYPSFRRMGEYSKVGIAAISFALKDAEMDRWAHKRNIGVIVSTEYGCLGIDLNYYETVMREGGTGASPALFAYTLSNSFLGEAAIRFGITGKAFVVNEPCPLGLTCLRLALGSIALGECDQMIFGVNNVKHPPPFDAFSKAPPGALFFLIEKSPSEGIAPYGELRWKKSGVIEFEKSELRDLSELVGRCMAR